MKNIRIILSLVLMMITFNAEAAKYVVVRLTLRGYRIVYVNKPKNLKRWAFDSKNDVYYRVRSVAGIPLPMHLHTITGTPTKYVSIKPDFWGVTMAYVDKPKNMKKWHYDKITDTYYRGRNTFGVCDIVFKDRSTPDRLSKL